MVQQAPTHAGIYLIVAVFSLVPLIACVVLCVRWMNGSKRRAKRGFEVKLNMGEEPVMKEKENDHG